MRPLLLDAVYDGWDFGLQFAQFKGIADITGNPTYRGRFISQQQHPHYRHWRFHRQVIDDLAEDLFKELLAFAPSFNPRIDGYLELIRSAKTHPEVDAFTFGLTVTIYPLPGTEIAVSTPIYHPGVVALAKAMGGRWMAETKAWRIANASPATMCNNLMQELRLPASRVKVLDGEYVIVDTIFARQCDIRIPTGEFPEGGTQKDSAAISGEAYLAVTAQMEQVQAVPFEHLSCFDLKDYQYDGARHLMSKTGALLADDMGLGKSRQAAVAATLTAGPGGRILVTCPASLVINWAREIQQIDHRGMVVIQKYDPAARWVVMNYERLGNLQDVASEFDVVILDEVHLLKEPGSQRTRLTFDIVSKIRHRYLLTGTPILNRESELHTLLKLSGHPVGDLALADFESQYTGSEEFRRELNLRIREWMLRRKKDIVLKSLLGKQRQTVSISLDAETRTAYDQAFRDPFLIGIEKITRLRQELEIAKVPAILDMLSELGGDDKALIFAEFKNTINMLTSHLDAQGIEWVCVTGDNTPKQRQSAVDRFQCEVGVRVFIGTTAAAGVGLNLTAANYVLFAGLPWTPALLEQAEDRAYRLGQFRVVVVKIPLVENSIDQLLWGLLAAKRDVAAQVISPDDIQQRILNTVG